MVSFLNFGNSLNLTCKAQSRPNLDGDSLIRLVSSVSFSPPRRFLFKGNEQEGVTNNTWSFRNAMRHIPWLRIIDDAWIGKRAALNQTW